MRALLLIIALALAMPAHAASMAKADEHRKIMRRFADCLVDAGAFAMTRNAIEAVTNNPPKSKAALDGAADIARSWCPTQMAGHGEKFDWFDYSATAIRGQLFRALYARHFDLTVVPNVAAIPIGSDPMWRLPAGDSYRPPQMFGECVARRAPAESMKAVFSGSVGSAEENRAYVTLRPIFAQCISPGVTMTLTRAFIEAAVAEALFHFRANGPVAIKMLRGAR